MKLYDRNLVINAISLREWMAVEKWEGRSPFEGVNEREYFLPDGKVVANIASRSGKGFDRVLKSGCV
jgi:hypothetical protein